jgi:cytochrome c oxidase subunit IV
MKRGTKQFTIYMFNTIFATMIWLTILSLVIQYIVTLGSLRTSYYYGIRAGVIVAFLIYLIVGTLLLSALITKEKKCK